MDPKHLDVLSRSVLFHGLTKEEIDIFLSKANVIIKSYKKDSFVALSGDPMEGIGVLLEGKVLLTRENIAGHRSIVSDFAPPDMFGEVLLFTENPLWPATIQTVTPTKVLFLPPSAFTGLVPGCAPYQTQLLLNLLHDLSQKAILLTRKVHYLSLKSMRHKIFAYLQDLHKKQQSRTLKLPHSRQEMADVLNVCRTALSREIGRLVKENHIAVKGKEITILTPHLLSDFWDD